MELSISSSLIVVPHSNSYGLFVNKFSLENLLIVDHNTKTNLWRRKKLFSNFAEKYQVRMENPPPHVRPRASRYFANLSCFAEKSFRDFFQTLTSKRYHDIHLFIFCKREEEYRRTYRIILFFLFILFKQSYIKRPSCG